jgi:hypothetical protein
MAHDCTACLASEFDFANHDLTIVSNKFSESYLNHHIACLNVEISLLLNHISVANLSDHQNIKSDIFNANSASFVP